MRIRKLLWLATTSLMWLGVTQAQATSFNNVVIFGDSLSDGGNIALSGSNPQARFTTNPGLTAAELVAEGVGTTTSPSWLGGSNYAWGGAGVVNSLDPSIPTLQQQLLQYLGSTSGTANPNTLYEVWGGANDIFGLLGTSGITQAQLITGTTTAANTELNLLSSLKQAGANYVVVYNLPNMGLTPSALESGTTVAGALTQLAQLYNYNLSNGLDNLSASGLNIVPVNVYGLLNEVVANPAAYGFSNVTNEACGVGSSSVACGPAGSGAPYTYAPGTNQSYLFADGVHPTTATHRLLAQAVLAELAAPGQMSLLSEAPLAITKAQYRAVKNEMLTDVNGGETRVFFNLDYNHQKLKASDSSPQLNSSNVNFTFGSDAQINPDFSAGVAMSLNQQNGNFSNSQGNYKLFDVSGLGYGIYHKGNGYIGGFANAGSLHFTDIKRQIQLGTAVRTETADAQGYHVGGGLDGGWWLNLNDLKTGPFVHLEWQTIKVNDFSEHGADSTAMWFGKQQRDSFVSSVGWRLKGDWMYRDVKVSPFAEVAWNYDSQASSHDVRAGLNSMGGSFVLSGYTPDKKWGSASLGLTTQYTPNLSAWASANGEFANHSADNLGVNLGMKYSF
ncbi:autotransporter domain-containing protein [Acinetobacter sp. ANC 3791]|uniref:autotransporter domain-containing protein n=1 Tax=Acinetobacter sp. ANC 3791 TaxID=2529836 RepID=UPI00103CB107|nr:autotransporter domain-containing protein [Acinetobacter sp. ANC 3791]TCB85776.1 autotransporter domain-containing protein [Acinetobacter sp. ANC 3791]